MCSSRRFDIGSWYHKRGKPNTPGFTKWRSSDDILKKCVLTEKLASFEMFERAMTLNKPFQWIGLRNGRVFSYMKVILEHFCQTGCGTAPINCLQVQVRDFILYYYWNRFTCFNDQKTHQFSHTVQCCSSVFPLCLSRSVLAPVSLRPLLLNN